MHAAGTLKIGSSAARGSQSERDNYAEGAEAEDTEEEEDTSDQDRSAGKQGMKTRRGRTQKTTSAAGPSTRPSEKDMNDGRSSKRPKGRRKVCCQ